jgi:DNA-binding CsgD family transcriptional regulator
MKQILRKLGAANRTEAVSHFHRITSTSAGPKAG